MAILGFELEEIAQVLAVLEARGLDEIVLEEEGRFLRVRRTRPTKLQAAPVPLPQAAPVPSPPAIKRQASPVLPAAAPPSLSPDALPPGHVTLKSPMVGTFYRAEKPGAPPLVEVGQTVSVGQTIGIIEAMKIFSEVPAEESGVVVSIPAKDGALVQTDAPLFVLRKTD